MNGAQREVTMDKREPDRTAAARQPEALAGLLLVYASLWAILLRLVSYYVITPLAFPHLAEANPMWRDLVANALFVVTLLCAYIVASRQRRSEGA